METVKKSLSLIITIVLATGVIGLGAKEIQGIFSLVKAKAVETWPVAAGEILRSEALPRSSALRRHEIQLTFSFEVDGKTFESTTLRTLGNAVRFKWTMEEAAKRFPKGSDAIVHYNPKDPAEAYLEAGTTWLNYWAILGPMIGILLLTIPLADRIVALLGQRTSSKRPPAKIFTSPSNHEAL